MTSTWTFERGVPDPLLRKQSGSRQRARGSPPPEPSEPVGSRRFLDGASLGRDDAASCRKWRNW
jgi:hypothetical protein